MTHDLARFGFSSIEIPSDIGQPTEVNPIFGGFQAIWHFPNNRGASVINHSGSYGTELAVLRFNHGETYDLDYSTPLTSDVIPHIKGPEELIELLRRIKDLTD